MVESQQVSRPGNEQILAVEHDGETVEAELRTIIREVDGEEVERSEYYVDEDVPDPVAEEIARANDELAKRGADENEDLQEEPDVVEEVTAEEEG